MKNISILIVGMVALLSFNSCSKDDPEVTADFLGKWKLKEVNFIDDNVEPWHKDTEATRGNLLFWAPFMYSQILGYELRSHLYIDEEEGVLGSECVVVDNEDYNADDKVFWVWDVVEDNKSFKITQLNNKMPPYNFSLTDAYGLTVSKNGAKDVLEFTTTVSSVNQNDINKPLPQRSKIQVKARITIERMGDDEKYKKEAGIPVLKLKDKVFELPAIQR